MGEYVGIHVMAGGGTTRKAWRKALKAVDELGFSFELTEGGALEVEDESNYGDTSGIRSALREAGLAYRTSCVARYDVEASAIAWAPGMEAEVESPADQDGGAMVELDTLKKAMDRGEGIAEVLARYAPLMAAVPGLVIDGVPAVEADLERDGRDDEEDEGDEVGLAA